MELYELTALEYISLLKKKVTAFWDNQWKYGMEATAKGLFLRDIRDHIASPDNILTMRNRRQQVVLSRLRMGHAGLQQYLYRFQMAEDDICESCDLFLPETIEHFLLICSGHEAARFELKQQLNLIGVGEVNIKTLLLGNSYIGIPNG